MNSARIRMDVNMGPGPLFSFECLSKASIFSAFALNAFINNYNYRFLTGERRASGVRRADSPQGRDISAISDTSSVAPCYQRPMAPKIDTQQDAMWDEHDSLVFINITGVSWACKSTALAFTSC